MSMEISEKIFDIVAGFLIDSIQTHIKNEEFFTRRTVKGAVEKAVQIVVKGIAEYLTKEGIGEDQQDLLISICTRELNVLVQEPQRLFQGSLNSKQVFDQLYAGKPYPEEIRQEQLEGIYETIGLQITGLLCYLPLEIDRWRLEKWQEGYRRFDELAKQSTAVLTKLSTQDQMVQERADKVLKQFRNHRLQSVCFEMDLTGLRADNPWKCRFDVLFVHPTLDRRVSVFTRVGQWIRSQFKEEADAFSWFAEMGRRSVLIGPPGAGKSTWSQWFERRVLEDQSRAHGPVVAIRVILRDYTQTDPPSYQSLLRKAAGTHLEESLDNNRLERWIQEGRIAFVLDGFDELPPARRDMLWAWIKELAVYVEKCPIIVTSRPLTSNHLDKLPEPWENLDIQPFDKDQVRRYMRAWYQYAPLLDDSARNINTDALSSAWSEDPTLGPLTGNPLLLSTLLMVHHLDGQLPQGRAKLYQRYVDGMLGTWDQRRRVAAAGVELTTDQKRKLLQKLALEMHMSGQDSLVEELTEQVIFRGLESMKLGYDAGEILKAIQERTGLLVGPGVYNFAHKSIAEFLVAELIVQGNERDVSGKRIDRWMLFEHRHEDRWNTVLFLWAGLAPQGDVEDFVEHCLQEGEWAEISLGIGILQDQERLSDELRRMAIKKLTNSSKPTQVQQDTFGFGLMARTPFLRQIYLGMLFLQSADIRSIGRMGLYDFLEAGFEKKLWGLGELRTSADLVYLTMLFITLTRAPFVDLWQSALSEGDQRPPPLSYRNLMNVRNDGWWLATWVTWLLNRQVIPPSSADIEQSASALLKHFPQHKGQMALALMAEFTLYFTKGRRTPLVPFMPTLTSLLENVDDHWLIRSDRCSHLQDSDPFDLLTVFESLVHQQIDDNLLPNDTTTQNVLIQLTQLKEHRTTLQGQSSPDSKDT